MTYLCWKVSGMTEGDEEDVNGWNRAHGLFNDRLQSIRERFHTPTISERIYRRPVMFPLDFDEVAYRRGKPTAPNPSAWC